MPRSLSVDQLASLTSDNLKPAVFVVLTFATETAYIWSGTGNISWMNKIWLGLGSLLNISALESGATIEARGITVTLSALDPNLLKDCMTEFKLGLPAQIYLGLFDSDNNLIDIPIASWAGRTGQPTVLVSTSDATIAINCESRLVDLNIAPDRRYTQEDQTRYYPGDLGFSFVTEIAEKTIFWGDHPLSSNNI